MIRSTSQTTGSREVGVALIITLVLLAMDFGSFAVYPTSWCDEVSFAEPAINLATQGNFETAVWPAQPAGTFWTANTPLYPVVLAGWVKCFGQSLLAVRSLNYLLISIASLGIWFLARRFQLSSKPNVRLLLIPLVHLGYGVSFAYRSCRPDILGLIIFIAYACSLGCSKPARRYVLCAVCGIAAVWTGPQLGLLIGIGAIMAWRLGWIRTQDVFATAAGGFVGIASFVCLLLLNHALPNFMASLALGRTGGVGVILSPKVKAWRSITSYIDDYSLPSLLAVSAYFILRGWKLFDRLTRQRIVFLGVLILIIPALLNATSKYGYYYSYMVYVPACLLTALTFDRTRGAERGFHGSPTWILAGACAAAMMIGMPTRLFISLTQIHFSPRDQVEETLRRHVRKNDIVLAENAAFFETKSITPRVFGELYYRFGKLSDMEKSTITVLVIYPQDFENYATAIGGKWVTEGEPFGDERAIPDGLSGGRFKKIFDHYFSSPQMIRATLQVYRRADSV